MTVQPQAFSQAVKFSRSVWLEIEYDLKLALMKPSEGLCLFSGQCAPTWRCSLALCFRLYEYVTPPCPLAFVGSAYVESGEFHFNIPIPKSFVS